MDVRQIIVDERHQTHVRRIIHHARPRQPRRAQRKPVRQKWAHHRLDLCRFAGPTSPK